MRRNMRTRIEKLMRGREPQAVLDALAELETTGRAPESAAGDRATELWDEALSRSFAPGFEAGLWCHLQATGKSVADVFAEAPAR